MRSTWTPSLVSHAFRHTTFLETAAQRYSEWLRERGYSQFVVESYARMARHLGSWLSRHGRGRFADLNEQAVARFVSGHLPRCRCYVTRHLPRPHRYDFASVALRGLLTMLREQRLLPAAPEPAPPPSPRAQLLDDLGEFLRRHRGITEASIRCYRHVARAFLRTLPEDDLHSAIAALSLDDVRSFALEHGRGLSVTKRRRLKSALSALFGYLRLAGYSTLEVAGALPPVRHHRLAGLPVAISPEEVQRLLAAVDRSSRPGRRDYAMLLMLATYGLRSHEVRRLRLEDIGWRQQRLLIRAGKTARERILPLTDQVGDALYDYLRHERRAGVHREVFLIARPPGGPFRANPYHMVSKYFRLARIESPQRGAHTLRHSFAVQGVRVGLPLKTISDLLGHRQPDSTLIYAKLHVEDLRQVAMELEVSR